MPQMKISKKSVDAVPHPTKGQQLYSDTVLPGFYLIVGTKTKTFAVQKDIQGRSVRYTIGKYGHIAPDLARNIAQEKLCLMLQGINPKLEEAARKTVNITLDEVLEEYFAVRRKLKPRTRSDYRKMMDLYLGNWKNKRMADITKHMVAKRHSDIAAKHGPYPANKIMRILRALFNYAIATHDIVPANPVLYLTHMKAWYKETPRRTYIKPHDLNAWWQGVQSLENCTYRDFLTLLLFTGLRRNEAASLKWSNVCFRAKEFTIEDTKNGDPLTLPLGSFLLEMLMERRKRFGNCAYVFPGPGKHGFLAEPKKGVKKVIENSNVQFICHDLRRTFITIAESLDISTYALKRLINHRVTDVTGGYIIVDVERLRGPVAKIESFILEKVDVQANTRNEPLTEKRLRISGSAETAVGSNRQYIASEWR